MSDSLAGDQLSYAIPSGAPTILDLAPRKTSWDAGTASSQIALAAYLDHVEELAEPKLASARLPSGDGEVTAAGRWCEAARERTVWR